jgi:hypothetical protein
MLELIGIFIPTAFSVMNDQYKWGSGAIAGLPRKPKPVLPTSEINRCLRELRSCCIRVDGEIRWPDATLLRRLDAALGDLLEKGRRRKKPCVAIGSVYQLVDSRWRGLHLAKTIASLMRRATAILAFPAGKNPLPFYTFHYIFQIAQGETADAGLARDFLEALEKLLRRQRRPLDTPWESYRSLLLHPSETILRLEIGDVMLRPRVACYFAVLERLVLHAFQRKRQPIGPTQASPLLDWAANPGLHPFAGIRSARSQLLRWRGSPWGSW